MSITGKKIRRVSFIFAFVLLSFRVYTAQEIEATIKLESLSPAVARVEGKFTRENVVKSAKNWAFSRSFAGIENLGARISDLNLKDERSRAIAYKKLIDGEYLAEDKARFWSYQINLSLPRNEKASARVSWATSESGILMLGDLLPQFVSQDDQPISARIKFELPTNWKISGERDSVENVFETANVEKAVFLIGKNQREKSFSGKDFSLDLAISGEWNFSDEQAVETAQDISSEYEKLFGGFPGKKARIFIVKFPPEIKFGRWEADTRGSNVTIVSSDMPFQTLSLQRLHEQLRHELFHLWIPNNLALTGNYDWFYEGFTVYQSLKTGVALNRIRFEDFLETLSEAYNLDDFQEKKVSLIEASKNRWNGANPQVYSRGMIVAFLSDIALLRESRGKRSLSDAFRLIYKKYRKPNAPEDGNAAILNVLENYPELRAIIERYVKGAEKINWETDLESVGIEATATNYALKLNVKTNLNGRQKDLLNELGYNNWRKITRR